MARSSGRSSEVERLRAGISRGHWEPTTFVGALRLTGMAPPMVLDGPINCVAFQAYVDQVLIPQLKAGDIVVMDNLGSHPARACARIGGALNAAGREP